MYLKMSRQWQQIIPIFSAPNTIVTPHIAFATREAMVKRAVTVFENVKLYLKGTPQNVM